MMSNDDYWSELARYEAKENELHYRIAQAKEAREQANKSFSDDMRAVLNERISELSEELKEVELEVKVLRENLPFMLRRQAR